MSGENKIASGGNAAVKLEDLRIWFAQGLSSYCDFLYEKRVRKTAQTGRAGELYENSMKCFRDVVASCAAVGWPPSDERDGFYRVWGDAGYVLAVDSKGKFYDKDTEKFFREAAAKYERIDEKDDDIRRRLGNAYYELAAIYIDKSKFEDAEKSLEKAAGRYAEIGGEKSNEDKRIRGNALFENGRVKWLKYLLVKENKDPTYKRSVYGEAKGLFPDSDVEAVEGRCGGLAGDGRGIEKELSRLFSDVDNLFKEATAEYNGIPDAQKSEDIWFNLGEIYAIRGRKGRYDYLYHIEQFASSAWGGGTTENEIADGVKTAVKNFEIAIWNFEKVWNKRKGAAGDLKWVTYGATCYRLYLTRRVEGHESPEEADKAYGRAKQIFEASNQKILDIFNELSLDVGFPLSCDKIFFSFLDKSGKAKEEDATFFNETVSGKLNGWRLPAKDEDVIPYKRVYIRLMYIISRLEVEEDYEEPVAYYTSVPVAYNLLFKGGKFRMNAAGYFNDPAEGKVLLCCLNPGRQRAWAQGGALQEGDGEFVVYAGSFSFNCDSLNQFRLYGKQDGREGSGAALVFNTTFFTEPLRFDAAASMKDFENEFRRLTRKEGAAWDDLSELLGPTIEKQGKHTLFRCVYVDPRTGRVDTVGQKEKYLFYRKKNGKTGEMDNNQKRNADKIYENYAAHIQSVVEDVDNGLRELKRRVRVLRKEIFVPLMLPLRYLVKPVSFKEEQECRILKFCKKGDNAGGKITIGAENNALEDIKLHYEYNLSVPQHVRAVYFGPNAAGMDMFKVCLRHEGLDKKITCERSETRLS